MAHGAGRGACYLSGLPDVVGAQPLDPLGRMSSVRHGLTAQSLDQSARISSTRQAVVLTPSFTGFGKRPSLTPCHQVDLLTGIGPDGAMIEARRTKPVSGRVL